MLALIPALADSLQLKFKHKESITVERMRFNLGESNNGMPDFLEALKIELTPVANQAYDNLYEPIVLKKLKFEPFYFRLGQEIRV